MVALSILVVATALSANGETALINFSGPSCPNCKAMEPVVTQLEASGAPVKTIDVEKHPEIAQRFGVSRIPTYVMLVDDKETGRWVGQASVEKLASLVSGGATAAASPAVQTPVEQPPGNYLGQRLGGLFGKNNAAAKPSSPGTDPFTSRGALVARTDVPTESQSQEPKYPVQQTEATFAIERDVRPSGSPTTRAMAASVRLKVADAAGFSIGSGTIIDAHGSEALVITCGHIFRDSNGKGKISVDLFAPEAKTVEGTLLGYDLKRDIAVLLIKPGVEVVAAQVTPEGTMVAKSDAGFTIGCNKGAEPTLRETQITGVDRYQGPPNFVASGAPVDGRSGGGLFSREGYLIGVCNAADPQDDEGIYAATPTVYWQLDQVGLTELYKKKAPTALAEVAPPARANVPRNPRVDLMPDLVATAPVEPKLEHADLHTDQGSDTEVIMIVRSKSNPSARNQVIVLDRVTPELMSQLAGALSMPTAAADMNMTADRRSALPRNPEVGPILRGQSRQ